MISLERVITKTLLYLSKYILREKFTMEKEVETAVCNQTRNACDKVCYTYRNYSILSQLNIQ